MYPLNTSEPYPRDQWYIAGYKHEFRSKTLGRRIFGEPLIFFRTEEGEPVALWGLCAHRFMPLENLETQNGSVVCPYHGYAYGADGRCHAVPTGGTPSIHAKLKRYPLVERGPFVWIWMGNADAPDFSLLPDPSDIGLGDDQSGWCVDIAATLPLKARAALLVDNLFDLSHLAFIHSKTVPGGAALYLLPPTTETVKGRLRVTRTATGIQFDGTTIVDTMYPIARDVGPVCSDSFTDMYNPSLINAGGPYAHVLNEDGTRGKCLGRLNFVHGLTPETDNSTHYFGVVTRDYLIDDRELSNFLIRQTDDVRAEDVVALEAIESVADDFASTKREISTKVDEGAIKARQMLRRLVESDATSQQKVA